MDILEFLPNFADEKKNSTPALMADTYSFRLRRSRRKEKPCTNLRWLSHKKNYEKFQYFKIVSGSHLHAYRGDNMGIDGSYRKRCYDTWHIRN